MSHPSYRCRRRAPLLGAVVAPLALAACSPEVLGPGRRFGGAPSLELSVVWLTPGDTVPRFDAAADDPVRVVSAPGLLVVDGALWPGERGGFEDETLRVNGVAATSTRIEQGARHYALELPASSGARVVRITLPRLRDVTVPLDTLVLTGVEAEGPAEVTAAGEAIRFTVRTAPAAEQRPAPSFTDWDLTLRRGGRSATISGRPSIPVIVAPLASLVGDAGALDARLLVRSSHTTASAGQPMQLSIHADVRSLLRWSAIPVPAR